MSTSQNLNKYHKTRFKNCKGTIMGGKMLGGRLQLLPMDFVHWCPTKKVWQVRKEDCILPEKDNYVENRKLATKTIKDILCGHYNFRRNNLKLSTLIWQDLQLDSLKKVQICILIERELNIQIYDKEKDSCSTIEDLINLVENKLIAKKK